MNCSARLASKPANLNGEWYFHRAAESECSARLALQPRGFPPRRGLGGGPWKFGLSCWRRGKNPHRWKSRRAGERALRYRSDPDFPKRRVAQGSLFSLAVLPPRRGFGGVARGNSHYLVGGAARIRTAGKAAGPECGPCAPGRTAISARRVAQGSLSSLAALPQRRGLGGGP